MPDKKFTLIDAAKLTGVTVTWLRNNITRGLLKSVGERPLAGDSRTFGIEGLFSVFLFVAVAHSTQLNVAGRVSAEIVNSVDFGSISTDALNPTFAFHSFDHGLIYAGDPRKATPALEKANPSVCRVVDLTAVVNRMAASMAA